jgi:HSP20 family molecular chaperone IbpA
MSRRRIDQLAARMGLLVSEMHRLHFRFVQQERRGWQPLVNVYRYPTHYELCVELAGVAPGDVEINAGGRLVLISGVRRWPDLRCQRTGSQCRRTTLMEIEEGEFWREIELPEEIDGRTVELSAQQGLLWIRLQLK